MITRLSNLKTNDTKQNKRQQKTTIPLWPGNGCEKWRISLFIWLRSSNSTSRLLRTKGWSSPFDGSDRLSDFEELMTEVNATWRTRPTYDSILWRMYRGHGLAALCKSGKWVELKITLTAPSSPMTQKTASDNPPVIRQVQPLNLQGSNSRAQQPTGHQTGSQWQSSYQSYLPSWCK